jgi:serine/threonine-protein kinase
MVELKVSDDEPSPLSVRLHGTAKSDPPPPLSAPGERLALAKKKLNLTLKGWRLTRLLGVGPVTAAYEGVRGARDATERVVVKVMIGSIATHERAKSVFLRAAYAANRFNHGRVLMITEDGVDGEGAPFVIRPWADAEPLADLVARKPLGEAEVLQFAEQVLDALEMGHAHGLLHGALTPQNILITERGSIRLCDFATPPGMGALRGVVEDEVLAERRRGPFTAPERCALPPSASSEEADIYGLAACMYFALSGKVPRGASTEGSALAHTEAAALRTVAPGVSENMAAVVDHALNLDPTSRYDSAYAMLGDVRRVMVGRRPKLADAMAPVPSQGPAELVRIEGPVSRPYRQVASLEPAPRSSVHGPQSVARRVGSERRGNAFLILAIAILVGVATFVLVREKRDDRRPRAAPSTSLR